MQRALILLLIFATCSWANTGGKSPLIHTLKSGAQFILSDIPVEKVRPERPRNPLDQGGDDCFSPTVISTLPYCDTGSTAGYNDDYYEECPQTQTAPDVVYEFAPLSDMTISISLLGSSYDTHLQVYETDTDCNNYWYYACDGDQGGQQSCIMGLTVYAGYIYYIIVDGENGGFGNYILNVVDGFDCPSAPCDNGGDTCENPLSINSLPYCDTRNTLAYNDDYFPECNSGACGERDVVYEYVPTSDLFLGISVASTEFQPHVEIWESDTDCSNSYLLGCANIHDNGNSCITGVDVYAGYRYYVYVDGHECGGDGVYTLNIYEGGGCSYAPCSGGGNGDNCATAIQVMSLPFNYSGTTDGLNNDYNFCAYEDGAPDIVFSYSPTTTHLADILTCGNTLFESSLYIFRDGNLFDPFSNCTPRSCYTSFGGFWFNAALYCFEFEVGHDYCIVVDGTSANSFGPFVLDIIETQVELCNIEELCPLPDTETEPNSSCNPLQFDPDTLVFGDEVAGTICDPGDRDFYWVITPEDRWNIIGVQAGPNCDIGGADMGISFVYPNGCYFTDPCNTCSWISGCGPETVAVMIAGLGDCYTGPYRVLVDSITVPYDECDPIACTTAPAIECNVPTLVNTCDGCSSPICQAYRNGCGGDRAFTGPQKFYRIDVPSTGNYTIDIAAVDTTADTQFSIFTDCVLPKTTCVFSQDQNYWAQNPTGPRWTETGTVSLDAGTYYLHVSQANSTCGDINLLVSCDAAPCLPPDSVTIKWTTASTAEIRFISDGGTYDIFSTNFPNNDGDPRGGDPQWSQRATLFGPAGPALWTDTDVTSAYRNYVIVKVCP